MPRFLVPLLVLALLGGVHAGDAGRWVESLEAAKERGRKERKPVLCVLLEPGSASSSRLAKELDRSKKLQPLLDGFVCVRAKRSAHRDLVEKYDLKHSPSTVIFSSAGTPLKLIVGPTGTSKYAAHLKAALKKDAEIWKPKRPTVAPPKPPLKKPEVPRRIHAPACPTDCEACKPAIARALGWLKKRQERDGRWKKPRGERVTKTERGAELDRSIDQVDIALTATAGLALLASGSTPEKGPHRKQIAAAVRFLEAAVRPDGIVAMVKGNDYLYLAYANFETALAAIFLAEVQAVAPTLARKKKLELIAAYLVRIQGRSGAWGYSYDFGEHPRAARRGWRLLATTHCCLTALNDLSAAGVAVPRAARERAAAYLLRCRGRNGAFVYKSEQARMNGIPGSSAGALYALERSGAADPAALEGSWKRYRSHYAKFDEFGRHWWFFLFFTALSLHHRGEGAYRDFQREFRDLLLHQQQDDGRWKDPDEAGGSVYATAVAAVVLQLDAGHLPLASRRHTRHVSPVKSPTYLKAPHPSSRVKVFEHQGKYRFDLIVSIDGPATKEYLEQLRMGIRGANRTLFDATDGQMSMHRVEILTDRGKWEQADIRISKEFYSRDTNPHPWAHGITRLSKVTDIRNGRETKRKRIGDWILFPPRGIRWDLPRFQHVMAHELCHYLFGAKDEYNQRTGESYCACIQGRRGATELCTGHNHTDDRQDADCWTLAKALYPKLEIPKMPDPGPWDPPLPVITLPE